MKSLQLLKLRIKYTAPLGYPFALCVHTQYYIALTYDKSPHHSSGQAQNPKNFTENSINLTQVLDEP